MRQQLWNSKEIAEVLQWAKEGVPYKEIAKRKNRSVNSIRKMLDRNGFKKNIQINKGIEGIIVHKIKYHNQTITSMAKKLNLSRGAVLRIARKHKLEPLPVKELARIQRLRMQEKGISTAAMGRMRERLRNEAKGWPPTTTNGEAHVLQTLLNAGRYITKKEWAEGAGWTPGTLNKYIALFTKRAWINRKRIGHIHLYKVAEWVAESRLRIQNNPKLAQNGQPLHICDPSTSPDISPV